MSLLYFAPYLLVLGGLAMIGVAQAVVRERSAAAALRLTIAGVLAMLPLGMRFIGGPALWTVLPLAAAGAAICAVWALFLLADELNPKQEGMKLPPAIESVRAVPQGTALGGRIVFAVVAVIAMIGTGQMMGVGAALGSAVLAVVAVIVGAHFINLRGCWAVWVLERHPEWVVWIYPSQLTVINRKYGTRTVYWRAILGLENGLRVTVPASSEQTAGIATSEAAKLCPDASVGHSYELEAKFRASPASMRRSGGLSSVR